MALTHRFFSEAFRDMQRAMNSFDQSFYNTARRSVLGSPSSLLNQNIFSGHLFRYPATDMVEHSDSYELNAELPGFDKSNIKIELADSRTLVLSGSMNKQQESFPADKAVSAESSVDGQQIVESSDNNSVEQMSKPSEESQFWVKERVSGSFSRSFAFPTSIDPDTIKASFENGILKITIPKAIENQAKQINIE